MSNATLLLGKPPYLCYGLLVFGCGLCKPSYPWCGPLVMLVMGFVTFVVGFGCLAMGVVTFVVDICFIFEL
jgi:hypothetical protein